MSRYIDADALIRRWDEMSVRGRTEFDQEIMVAPSIDIVRCKECKYWKWIEWAKESRCVLRNTAFNARADDFCSYGEVSERSSE